MQPKDQIAEINNKYVDRTFITIIGGFVTIIMAITLIQITSKPTKAMMQPYRTPYALHQYTYHKCELPVVKTAGF